MTVIDAIVFGLATSGQMLQSYVKDLSDTEWLHRPAPRANCAAWLLGHLTLTDRRAIHRLGVVDLPPLPDGFEKRFARDESAPHAAEYGNVGILPALFAQNRQRLIDTVKSIPPDKLDAALESPTPRFKTLGEMGCFMSIHTMMHAGQISTIRRSLGRAPLV